MFLKLLTPKNVLISMHNRAFGSERVNGKLQFFYAVTGLNVVHEPVMN